MADDEPQTLVGIAFPDLFRAQEFLTASARLAANGSLALRDAVFVTSDADGNTHVRETTDPQPKQAAVSGAVWVGLIGLIVGGPVGWLAGAAIGAGGGAVSAKAIDLGIPDEWVGWFRQAVQPGSTILTLLVTKLDRAALVKELERFSGAHLVYANLDASWQDRIRGALGETEGSSGTVADAVPEPEG
jgi:uncharacterized membrane protein